MDAPRIPGLTHVERIGGGGFADVYLYEQEWPRQRVAVKVVRPDLALSEHEKSLFTAEANAMARLADHPYIVSVITAGVTAPTGDDPGGRPYLVMRHCPPPDLGARVRQQPLSVTEAISTGIKLASAVETAHRAGILHRDVKPSNVLVTVYGEPALTDFGIAGPMHEAGPDTEVRMSYPWTPPELLAGTSTGSVASDVYSLGATIWNLLVGRSPYAVPGGDNGAHALSTRILHAPPPLTQRPDVPPALDRLLQQCLAKQPDHRPASALELARSLQRIEADAGYPRTSIAVAGDAPTPASTPAPPAADGPDHTRLKPAVVQPGPDPIAPIAPATPRPQPVGEPEPGGTARLWWSGLGAAVLVALVLGLWFARGEQEPPVVDPTPDASHTPLPVAPDAPARAPTLVGERTGPDEVSFSWESVDPARDGDSWTWTREDTGEGRRTTDRELVLTTSERVCVSVSLVRGGFASDPARGCVD